MHQPWVRHRGQFPSASKWASRVSREKCTNVSTFRELQLQARWRHRLRDGHLCSQPWPPREIGYAGLTRTLHDTTIAFSTDRSSLVSVAPRRSGEKEHLFGGIAQRYSGYCGGYRKGRSTGGAVPDCWFCCAFFLFIHYPHATYLDHGEDMYSPFPVRCFFFCLFSTRMRPI